MTKSVMGRIGLHEDLTKRYLANHLEEEREREKKESRLITKESSRVYL